MITPAIKVERFNLKVFSIQFGVITVSIKEFFVDILGRSEYGIAVLYPQYNGILFKFDTEGRNLHVMQNVQVPMQNVQVPMQPRKDEKQSKFIPKIDPEKCEGETFCEDANFYPYNEVDQQLSKAGDEYKYIFGIDDVQLTSKMDSSTPYPGTGEANGASRVILHSVCETKMRIIFPRIAKNKRNQWKYVVNQDVEKVQGIAVEWCKNTGDRCNYLTSKNKFMVPTCGQKYSFRRLLTLSHEGLLESDIFEFPVACMCYVKSYLFK
ncbi:protein spaetzle 5-like isoform X2 [Coccinella septempunctata]|uniref:protein spaetzle 5-like isoform X2 n=1 Tax=Coccinella septempunctata TaxID=41139 RepID=UPI001D07573E|nr:protein spaetzle 5-like isoform X2 [Coccinella septempunctata]